jgi:AraC-like DNA-binding protein
MVLPAHDPVLTAINDARQRRDQADHDIRLLLAYARELTTPRPYRLADLATAAGMSISGVRTAYTHDDIATAQQRWGSQ